MILQAVYEHEGNVKIYDGYNEKYSFDASDGPLMVADTYGLASISANGDKVKLTEKGKYFAKHYPYYAGR